MDFEPTPEQEARIEEARKAFEAAQRAWLKPSKYFVDKCSSEAGIALPISDKGAADLEGEQ